MHFLVGAGGSGKPDRARLMELAPSQRVGLGPIRAPWGPLRDFPAEAACKTRKTLAFPF